MSRNRSRSRSPARRSERRDSSPPPRRRDRNDEPPRARSPERRRGGLPRPPEKRNRQDDLSEQLSRLPESERFGVKAQTEASGSGDEAVDKVKPNFALSGKLAAETNTIHGVTLKYSEPQEAKKPAKRWRLHVFKGDQQLEPLRIYRQSAYLLGRERLVCDIPLDHPSCSKQHAVLQFRAVEAIKDDGTLVRVVKPYVIDLDSANGTFLNGERIEGRRFVELKEKDVLKFGMSSRDYVLLIEPLDAQI